MRVGTPKCLAVQQLYEHWAGQQHHRCLMEELSFDDCDRTTLDTLMNLVASVLESMIRLDTYEDFRDKMISERNRTAALSLPKSGGYGWGTYAAVRDVLTHVVRQRITDDLSRSNFASLTCDKRGDYLVAHVLALCGTDLRRLVMGAWKCSDKTGDTVRSVLSRNLPPGTLSRLHTMCSDGGSDVNCKAVRSLGVPRKVWCAGHRLQLVVGLFHGEAVFSDVASWLSDFQGLVRFKKYITDDLEDIMVALAEPDAAVRSSFIDVEQRWLSKLKPLRTVVRCYRSIVGWLQTVSATNGEQSTRKTARGLLARLSFKMLWSMSVMVDVMQFIKVCLDRVERDDADLSSSCDATTELRKAVGLLREKFEIVGTGPVPVAPLSQAQVTWPSLDSSKIANEVRGNPIDLQWQSRGLEGKAVQWNLKYPGTRYTQAALRTVAVNSCDALLRHLATYFHPDLGWGYWHDVFGRLDPYEDCPWDSVMKLAAVHGLEAVRNSPSLWNELREKASENKRSHPGISTLDAWMMLYKDSHATMGVDFLLDESEVDDVVTFISIYLTTPTQSASVERSFNLVNQIQTHKVGVFEESLDKTFLVASAFQGVPSTGLIKLSSGQYMMSDIVQESVSIMMSRENGRCYRKLFGLRNVFDEVCATVTNYGDTHTVRSSLPPSVVPPSSTVDSGSSESCETVKKRKRKLQPGDPLPKLRRHVGPDTLRPDHKQIMQRAAELRDAPVAVVPSFNDRLQKQVRATNVFNAALFTHVDIDLFGREYPDSWFDRHQENGLTMYLIGATKSKIPVARRVTLQRAAVREAQPLWAAYTRSKKAASASRNGAAVPIDLGVKVREVAERWRSQIDRDGVDAWLDALDAADADALAAAEARYLKSHVKVGLQTPAHLRNQFSLTLDPRIEYEHYPINRRKKG